MYFPFGFPRILQAGEFGREEEWIFTQHDHQHLVAISQTSVQLWSTGLHKLRLSIVVRSDENVEQEGRHVAAFWCSNKAAIAVLVRNKGCRAICPGRGPRSQLLSS